jgi:hypothetical protein
MTIQPGNLFADVADVSVANKGEETFSEILARPGLKIERIISQGQISPTCANLAGGLKQINALAEKSPLHCCGGVEVRR